MSMRIDGMITNIRVITEDLMGPAASKALAGAHRKAHEEIIRAKSGRVMRPSFEHIVDGRKGAPLDSVKPDGILVTNYDSRPEIVFATLAALTRNSPRLSGEYARSHIILVNGTQVSEVPSALAYSDVVTITNTVPYARRLEVGVSEDGTPFVVQVAPRIYERTAKREIIPQFRQIADIRFAYVDISGAYRRKRSGGRRDRGVGSAIRYPAIIIKSL